MHPRRLPSTPNEPSPGPGPSSAASSEPHYPPPRSGPSPAPATLSRLLGGSAARGASGTRRPWRRRIRPERTSGRGRHGPRRTRGGRCPAAAPGGSRVRTRLWVCGHVREMIGARSSGQAATREGQETSRRGGCAEPGLVGWPWCGVEWGAFCMRWWGVVVSGRYIWGCRLPEGRDGGFRAGSETKWVSCWCPSGEKVVWSNGYVVRIRDWAYHDCETTLEFWEELLVCPGRTALVRGSIVLDLFSYPILDLGMSGQEVNAVGEYVARCLVARKVVDE